jgi:FtsP/CotA-like multicopper oxidase with cupredoxin domain
MTRLNVYAGPAGFYLIRGGPSDAVQDRRGGPARLPGPAPSVGDPAGTRYYEIPLAIQDRSFDHDGQLYYPSSREEFDGYAGPYVPDSDIAPIWNPEFFGTVMTVNGRPWPYLEVEQRRYRLRLLNGCNSRFLLLAMDRELPFWVIGNDGGLLPGRAVRLDRLLMAPAERLDVVVDFSQVPVGAEIVLGNLAPDEPFGGGEPGPDFDPAHPGTTGRVMQFRVVPAQGADSSTPPAELTLPAVAPLGAATQSRRLSLNEADSEILADVGPRAALLGGLDPAGAGVPMLWADPVTENPGVGDTEIWELHNLTVDAHPMHLHLVQFEVLEREGADGVRGPEPWETGGKDTAIAYPGEVTRLKARFSLPGRYVWHCHIVEHEDNEMMRPFHVGPMGHLPDGHH